MAGGPASLLASKLWKGAGQGSEEAGIRNRGAVYATGTALHPSLCTKEQAGFLSRVFTPIDFLILAFIH